MPKGDIEFKNSGSMHYDDVHKVNDPQLGEVYVVKRAYSHDVRVVSAKDVEQVTDKEWHQTPFGSCKKLSDSEVNDALRQAREKKE